MAGCRMRRSLASLHYFMLSIDYMDPTALECIRIYTFQTMSTCFLLLSEPVKPYREMRQISAYLSPCIQLDRIFASKTNFQLLLLMSLHH